MGKILQIALKLNFPPNTLGCYGLISRDFLKKKRTFNVLSHAEREAYQKGPKIFERERRKL